MANRSSFLEHRVLCIEAFGDRIRKGQEFEVGEVENPVCGYIPIKDFDHEQFDIKYFEVTKWKKPEECKKGAFPLCLGVSGVYPPLAL